MGAVLGEQRAQCGHKSGSLFERENSEVEERCCGAVGQWACGPMGQWGSSCGSHAVFLSVAGAAVKCLGACPSNVANWFTEATELPGGEGISTTVLQWL